MTDMLERVATNPRGWSPGVSRDRGYRAAEVPGANGHGNARSVARVAAALASGGARRRTTAAGAILRCRDRRADLWTGPGARPPDPLGARCRLAVEGNALPGPRSFYWGGWGGSLCLVDLDAQIACAYVMNKMSHTTMGDRRGLDLVAAVYASL